VNSNAELIKYYFCVKIRRRRYSFWR